MELEIETVVQQCIAGERRAQVALFDHYKDTVLRIVCRMLGSLTKLDVEDTVQKAYVALFKSLHLYQGLSSFDTWVYRICTKVCVSQIRTKYRKRAVDEIDGGHEVLEHAGDSTYDPERELHNREIGRSLEKGMAQLSEERRVVLALYELENRSLEEIALIIGKPVGTVKSRLFRARKDMCDFLRKAGVV